MVQRLTPLPARLTRQLRFPDPRQADAISVCFRAAGLVAIEVHRDAAGRQRVVSARRES